MREGRAHQAAVRLLCVHRHTVRSLCLCCHVHLRCHERALSRRARVRCDARVHRMCVHGIGTVRRCFARIRYVIYVTISIDLVHAIIIYVTAFKLASIR